MLATMLSALLQVGIVLVIAGVVYFAMRRRGGPFLRFVGLQPTSFLALAAGAAVGLVVVAAILVTPGMSELASSEGTVAGDAIRNGSSAPLLLSLFVTAVFKTSLSEELLFRGVIGKRLIAWLGFQRGNFIQATLFGLVHLLLLLVPAASAVLVASMVLITGISGWINGWLNERVGGGSILPGWAAHAVANVSAFLWLGAGASG